MSEEYTEVELSDGTIVRCAPVPPTSIPQIVADHPDCQMPPPPIEEIPGRLGVTKTVARPGSVERLEWDAQVEKIRRVRERVGRAAQFVISITSWKRPGAKNFTSIVPKSWKFPERLALVGLKPAEYDWGRLADFIQYELLKTADDLGKVSEVAFGSVQPLTESEVEAVEEFFRGEDEEESAAGGTA